MTELPILTGERHRGSVSNFANLIAISFVLHFLWTYYRNCYSKGYTMDIWHYFLLFNLVVIHVMLPFSRSDLNIFALGSLLTRTQGYITEAYLISALGYAGILLGGSLWRVELGAGLRRGFSRLIEVPMRGSLLLLSSRFLLVLHGLVAVTFIVCILLYYFSQEGFGFNLRGLLLVRPALRPVAQFTAFYSVLIGSYALARYWRFREGSMLLVSISIVVGLLFFGERGNLAAMASPLVLVLFIKMGRRLKPIWLATGFVAALALVFALDGLRQPNFSLSTMIGGFAISLLYGNSFSDTRDFAVVLSFWDGHYFYGLTYLAGLFAFVPRFLSSFRDTWSIGVVTARLAGFSPLEHPGLRVGVFGEAFFNFGLPGVIVLSLFIGATLRLIDLRMKQAITMPSAPHMQVFAYLILTMWIGLAENTSTASSVYSVAAILAISWLALRAGHFLKLTKD